MPPFAWKWLVGKSLEIVTDPSWHACSTAEPEKYSHPGVPGDERLVGCDGRRADGNGALGTTQVRGFDRWTPAGHAASERRGE